MIYQPPIQGDKQYLLYNCTGAQGFGRHWHYEIEILYCIKGSISVTADNEVHNVEAGEYIIVGSAAEHSFMPLSSNAEAMVLEFGSAFLGNLFDGFLNRRFESKPNSKIIADALQAILKMTFLSEYCDELMVRSKLYAIASAMLKEREVKSYIVVHDIRNQKRTNIIQPVLDFIAVSYEKPIMVQDAAKLTHYEVKSFCRAFKAATGMTFHQYLNSYRLGQACNLLKFGDAKINQVAKQCGIQQAKTFSRLFKKYTGVTPSEYIRRISKGEQK